MKTGPPSAREALDSISTRLLLVDTLFRAPLSYSCRRGTGESLDGVFALGDRHDRDTRDFANSPLEITIVCCDWSQNGAGWDMEKKERTGSDVDTVLLDAVDNALRPVSLRLP